MKDQLQLQEIAGYLPYGLKYYPSETSDLFHDAYADNSGFSSWDYISALEAKDEYALKLKSSHIFQCSPFISIEDGELFLGQFQSSLGFDVDDVYASEVSPLLHPMSDLILPQHILGLGYRTMSRDLKEPAWTLSQIQYIYKNHFDIHNLIGRGLAISIHDIPTK